MVDKNTLTDMERASVNKRDPGTLPDLRDIEIKGEDPVQRLESYLAQTGNPYCFRVGKTPVRLLFHNEEKNLQEKLRAYFLSLKSNDF